MEEIFSRRSIRQYVDKEVEKEKIIQLLKAGMQAPSAMNQQPWEFYVIENNEIKQQLANTSEYCKFIDKAPLLLVVVCNSELLNPLCKDFWQQDLSNACENILLEAQHLDLGGCWIGVAPDQNRMNSISEILQLDSKYQVFSMLSIGYPSFKKEKKEYYDENKVHYIK